MLIALVVLALAGCIGLAVVCYLQRRELQTLTTRQSKQNALQEARLKELHRVIQSYQSGSVVMGERLHRLEQVVQPLPDRLGLLEQRDPQSLSVTQAVKLVSMGASVDDLMESCSLSQAEAELVARLQKDRQARSSS